MKNKIEIICNTLNEKLAEDVVVIDFDHQNALTDYFIIATAKNFRHGNSLVDFVEEALKQNGYEIRNTEMSKDSGWFVLDCEDVIVHIFLEEDRAKYQLERLWADFHITKM